MTTLQLPLSHTPPYAILSLALFKNSQVQWQEASELSEPTYGDVKESKLFEPSSRRDFQERRYVQSTVFASIGPDEQIPLPPMPTMFESNTPFPEVQKVLDAFDDYLAYR